ncbi:hypothetical protein O181_091619 [Austropuccinia psidii MF-1]|uniref:Uncharacterized protein n=1 Tax=Austropuccinia psidii MF-1 TaxID=1389203 RepID=A0A9Q3IXY0_9BASI|nr:hypothetical protein [Austropuccinia psidii MF-1]
MTLKAQTHFQTICNVWVITPHGATQKFCMLILVHESLLAPSQNASDSAYHPYARIALPTCLRRSLPSLCSWMPARHASDASYHLYAHSALPACLQRPPHTGLILMLLQPPQDETTMPPPISALTTPYASAAPLFFSAAYSSYASAAPSIYASDATLNPPYA